MPATLYSADVVCPMSEPPLANGGVLVEGDRIVAVADTARLVRRSDRRHHIAGVLLPGLVNGHTHLELSDAAPLAVEGPYATWLDVVDQMVGTWSTQTWQRSAHRGVLQVLRTGTTAVFDTVTRGPAVPAAARAGLAGDSFVEISDVDATALDDVLEQLEHALGLPAEGRRVGVGPGAPTRLGTGVLRSLADLAKRRGAPQQIHAAAAEAEAQALGSGEGPLADRARAAGLQFEWLDGSGPTPVRYLDAAGALTPESSLVHGVRVDAREAGLLARLAVAVVCCPRVNERLRMGAVPLEHYAQAGTPMALGTESSAAAPDQDVLAEAAAWVQNATDRGLYAWPTPAGPVSLAEAAVRLATVDGARALGWGSRCGALEVGRRADLVGIEVASSADAVYRDIVEQGAGRQVLTVLAGVRKARRRGADEPWPAISDDSWRDQ